MFTKWLKVGMSDMQEWTEEVLEPNKTRLYSFVFLYACSNFMTGSESSPYNCRIWLFFDIFYSRFQLVSTFSICSKFCVENWLICCDMICKWVTCRSGCKRFWKRALHMYKHFIRFESCFTGKVWLKGLNYPEKYQNKPSFANFHF